MKITKTAAAVMAVLGAGYAQVGTAASALGDVIQLGCTLPGPVDPSDGFNSFVYSLEGTGDVGNVLPDFPSIVYGSSCTKAINTINPTTVLNGTTVVTLPNCGPLDVNAQPIGVWQQAAAFPSGVVAGQALVAGVVPVLLAPSTGDYALQQFTFVCVSARTGGIPNNVPQVP